jgi:uncharacterized glyoxalase superfamily protein PhnB
MTALAAIGIVTANIAESCRFYRLLGLDVPEPRGGEDHFEITLPNGLRLMWDTEALIKQLDSGWRRTQGQATTLAFECSDAADVDALHLRLLEAGFRSKTEPYDAFWGQRYSDIFDPDGNIVHLFAPL